MSFHFPERPASPAGAHPRTRAGRVQAMLGDCSSCVASSAIVGSADGGFARSAAGGSAVVIVATFPHRFGRASEFATARLTLIALSPIRSVVPSFVVFVFDLTQRSA